jgi:hypothetical protein
MRPALLSRRVKGQCGLWRPVDRRHVQDTEPDIHVTSAGPRPTMAPGVAQSRCDICIDVVHATPCFRQRPAGPLILARAARLASGNTLYGAFDVKR